MVYVSTTQFVPPTRGEPIVLQHLSPHQQDQGWAQEPIPQLHSIMPIDRQWVQVSLITHQRRLLARW